jgi:hypothetical protein
MRRAIGAAVLALLAAAALAGEPSDKDKAPSDKPADRQVTVGAIAGVVQDPGSSSSRLVIRVKIPYLEANAPAQQEYAQRQQQLLERQRAILANPNPQQRYQQMEQLQRDASALMAKQKDLFHVRHREQDVELVLAEEVKVRLARLPQAFDDKGNPKRYTPKEMKDLRGPEKLPGFAAERGDLQVGQTVLVQVAVRLQAAPAKGADDGARLETQKDKPTDSQKDKPPSEQSKLLAVLIVIADPMK